MGDRLSFVSFFLHFFFSFIPFFLSLFFFPFFFFINALMISFFFFTASLFFFFSRFFLRHNVRQAQIVHYSVTSARLVQDVIQTLKNITNIYISIYRIEAMLVRSMDKVKNRSLSIYFTLLYMICFRHCQVTGFCLFFSP